MNKPMKSFQERKDHAAKLPILLSARVRLNEEQRHTLRNAYRSLKEQAIPEALPAVGGSTVKTTTAYSVQAAVGCSDIVLRDLLASKDSLSIHMVLQLQRQLGVEVLTKTDLMNACKSYCDYIFND